ncbi:MAG: glutamine synthetase [Proteobacteria bacterium]|nr:glutamine synthetase [Pseudomonadota bacterium]
MDEPTIEEWMDRHHVEVVRTHATNLDGLVVGKYLNRYKFLKSLPHGHSMADLGLAMDLTGMPHLTFWHDFRHAMIGDIQLRPDMDTIISDGTDPDLGHVICDFTGVDGSEIRLCPRTLLKDVTRQIADEGFSVKAAFELEFFLFKNSFDTARRREYRHLEPVGASTQQNIYFARNAYHAKPFMDEVIKRLNWQKFEWESWSDEGGVGQVELNFPPADPVRAADTISRMKQIIYEVAVDREMSVSFMAQIAPGYANGLHIHHSLQKADGSSAFLETGGRSPLFHHWIAGILASMPGATSILCPTINAYRRLKEFSAPPTAATWGEENKSAALRVITRSDSLARIEHRLASGDANPYLALAAVLAGGLAGWQQRLSPPDELNEMAWGLPEDHERLPNSIMRAADALDKDTLLASVLGKDVVDYWVNTRKLEWLSFHSDGADPESPEPTPWEYRRYFELM